jgi:hypothetical protein
LAAAAAHEAAATAAEATVLPEKSKIKLPLWTINQWVQLNFVRPQLPRHYARRARERYDADPADVDLRYVHVLHLLLTLPSVVSLTALLTAYSSFFSLFFIEHMVVDQTEERTVLLGWKDVSGRVRTWGREGTEGIEQTVVVFQQDGTPAGLGGTSIRRPRFTPHIDQIVQWRTITEDL